MHHPLNIFTQSVRIFVIGLLGWTLPAPSTLADGDYFTKRVIAGQNPYCYQLLGNLSVEHFDAPKPTSLRRELNLRTGIATTAIQVPDGNIIRSVRMLTDDFSKPAAQGQIK